MNSMIMSLTENIDERNNILKNKIIFSTVFSLILGFAMPFMISEYVGLSVQGVAIVCAVVGFGFMIPLARNVKEYNAGLKNTEEAEEEKYTFRDMLRCIRTNKYMAIYLVWFVVYTLGSVSTAAGLFVSFYLFKSSQVTNLAMPLALIPGFILQGYSDRIQKKFGRRNTLMGIMFIRAAVMFLTYLSGYDNVMVIVVFAAVGGTFNFLGAVVMNFIVPDTIEYTRYKTREDCAGIFYALRSFVDKATQGLVGALGLAMLGWFGFQAVNAASFADLQGVTQPESAMWGMWFMYSLFPAICYLAAGLILMLYRLKDSDAQIMAQCNAGEITREECESRLSRKY